MELDYFRNLGKIINEVEGAPAGLSHSGLGGGQVPNQQHGNKAEQFHVFKGVYNYIVYRVYCGP
jgi:hypothetical protein